MPYSFILTTGVVEPNTAATKVNVQAEYLAVFGSDLLLDDSTPQGRLIDTETTARDSALRAIADIANQINPNIATGVFLQSIGAMHKLLPFIGTYAAATVTITGKVGVVIPASSRVSSTTGVIYKLNSQVTIPAGGSIDTGVTAELIGSAQNAAANTITKIVDGVLGWDYVNNALDSTFAQDQETDTQFRLRRNQMLSLWSAGSVEAIYSRVLAVSGVTSVIVRDNPSATLQFIDGVQMSPHSTWVCVDGGSDIDVANALLYAKQSGSPWTLGHDNGTEVDINVADVISGQNYRVLFTRVSPVDVSINITVSKGTYTGNAVVAVTDAIVAYSNTGNAGVDGLGMGTDVSPFEISGIVNIATPGIFVKKVEAAYTLAPSFTTNELPIELWQRAVIRAAAINVTVVV